MKQFYKDVIDFLKSEYSDGYDYNLEVSRSINSADILELRIKIGHGFVVKITNSSMHHVYCLYRQGNFIEERNQYAWQKELIDMIEGS
jgi:hypothetical protein